MFALLVLLLGLLLIFFEFFMPGGVIGATGALLFILGIVWYGMEADSIWELALVIVLAGLGLWAVFRIALWRIRQSGPEASIYHTLDQEGYRASEVDQEMLGKQGLSTTPLRPAGHIRVEGNDYQALSRAGFIDKGEEIEIVGAEGAHYIVKKVETRGTP